MSVAALIAAGAGPAVANMGTSTVFVDGVPIPPGFGVTQWYGADQMPEEYRTGVYQLEVPKGVDPMFRYWSGTQWYYGGHTPAEAMRAYQMLGIVIEPDQYRPWRGLDKWAGVPEIA